MEENTNPATASSIPAFMVQSAPAEGAPEPDDTAKAAEKAKRQAAREAAAQDRDAFDIRASAMEKSTSRLIEQAEYLLKIDNVVEKVLPTFIGVHSLGQVLDKCVELEDAVDRVENALKLVKGRITYAREVALPQRLDDEDTKTTTSADTGHRMSRTARVLSGIIPGLKDKAFEWLRKNNYGSLISETVNSSSLNAAAKELIENGKELPDDLFRTHIKDGVSITRKKAKAK